MRVLLLNDTSLVSGAERCLLDLLAAIAGPDSGARGVATGVDGDEIEPLLACPPGPLADAARALGIEVVAIRGTSGSLRLHPVHTPRALAELSAAALAVRRLAARRGVDLIHANTLRSGLVAAGARRLGGPPFAAFVHDALGDDRAQAAVSRAIRAGACVLFANSAFSAQRFGIALDDPGRRVVFNPIDLAEFDPKRYERAATRERLGLAPADLTMAVIAQITPWKGQRDALEILDALRSEHPGARLLIVGEAKFVARATRYDNRAYLAELRALARDRGLRVDWLGERADVPAILAAIDVVLVPSWRSRSGGSSSRRWRWGASSQRRRAAVPRRSSRPASTGCCSSRGRRRSGRSRSPRCSMIARRWTSSGVPRRRAPLASVASRSRGLCSRAGGLRSVA